MVTVQSLVGDKVQIFNTFQVKPFIMDCLYSLMKNLILETLHSEMILSIDPRASKFDGSKKLELAELIKQNAWKIVPLKSFPPNLNIVLFLPLFVPTETVPGLLYFIVTSGCLRASPPSLYYLSQPTPCLVSLLPLRRSVERHRVN